MKNTTLPKLVLLLALAAVMVAFAACGDDDDDDTSGAGTGTTPTTAAETVPTVTVGDNFFQPAELTVKAGDTVRWVWSGSFPHSVKLEDETSPTYTGSGTFEFTFTEPGRYEYQCGVHGESMPGLVIVE